MHKLMEYICNELEELERKADKEGKLSMAEIEYADKLTHIKKNLLRAEEMWEDSEYSEAGGSYARGGGGSYARGGSYEGGGSYARGGRGGNRGGGNRGGGGGRRGGGANQYGSYAMRGGSYEGGNYSGEGSEMIVEELRELMEEAPNERTKMEFQKFIQKIEQM